MVNLVYTYLTRGIEDPVNPLEMVVVPSIYIPGTTPHFLVSTEGNVNVLGNRDLV